jgi:hypothetical protein
MIRPITFLVLFFWLAGRPLQAVYGQSAADDSTHEAPASPFSLRGYGTINYFNFDWDTDPGRRAALDVERFVLYPGYRFNERVTVNGEIEFEHGGTGVALEFDKFEEFGEFETEIEKGGEVLLEQMYVAFALRPALNIRAGRFKVPFGMASVQDEPAEYFTTTRSEIESNIVPTNWYEVGVQLFGRFGAGARWRYALSLVNGLDATGFSSSSWIVRGHQLRFETINAEDLAVSLRLDYHFADESLIGLTAYYGDSADNRPKPDVTVRAAVSVFDVHATYERGPLKARGVALYGHLQNADRISDANRNLSNFLNVKRTPVGSAALGYYVALGYDVLALTAPTEQRLVAFALYGFYDTMADVEGDIFDNPRWERTVYAGGLNYHVNEEVVVKAEYAHRKLGTATDNIENTFSLGLGFEF